MATVTMTTTMIPTDITVTIIVLEEYVYISLSPFLLIVTYNNCYYKSNAPIVKFPY